MHNRELPALLMVMIANCGVSGKSVFLSFPRDGAALSKLTSELYH